MKHIRILLLSSLVGTATLSGQATTPDVATSPRTRGVASPSPLMLVLDSNRDGILSADEIADAPVRLMVLDRDDDGAVSTNELVAAMPTRAPRMHFATFARTAPDRASPDLNLVLALDANHDGVVQPLEIANAASSLKRLDANRDGVLTRDELRPSRDRSS